MFGAHLVVSIIFLITLIVLSYFCGKEKYITNNNFIPLYWCLVAILLITSLLSGVFSHQPDINDVNDGSAVICIQQTITPDNDTTNNYVINWKKTDKK